jgi:hypothetical protein
MIILDRYLIIAVVMFVIGMEIVFFGMARDNNRIIKIGVGLHIISLAVVCILLLRNILW